jgi:excisionase family DNA binding protein
VNQLVQSVSPQTRASEGIRGYNRGMSEEVGAIEPRFLTLDEVAQYLSISGPQAYSLVRSGDLPAMKIGGRGVWRVDRRQLEAYIERVHEDTRKWAEEHPLGKGKEPDES